MRRIATKKTSPSKRPARTTKRTRTKKPDKSKESDPGPSISLPNIPDRKDAEFNAVAIRTAFVELIQKKNGRKPTYEELSAATGLHRATVIRHVNRLKFDTERSVYRVLSDDVVLSIYKGAVKGATRDKKLWLQLFEGFTEKMDMTSDGKSFNLDQARKIEKGMSPEEAAAVYQSMVKGENEDDD